MMKYCFEVYYTPGKFLVAADALSRHPLKTKEENRRFEEEEEQELQAFINNIISDLPISQTKIGAITQAQKEDKILKLVTQYCLNGWPDRYQIPPELRQFYNDRFNLSVNNEILMYGQRIIIPPSLRSDILEKIHSGHLGIVKCKARAKQTVWWPGYAKDVEDYVKRCSVCIQHVIPRHESFISSEQPERPWQVVGIDLFFHKSNCFLIVSDYFSRYPEIAKIENQTTDCIINHLKSIFSRHGIPNVVRSDNGPQFKNLNQSSFTKFAHNWGFSHITSSPRYPQSNGFIESAVKTVKALLKKNTDPYVALMEYRATPMPNGLSPAEMLMGRKLRTTLPINDVQLTPNFNTEDPKRKFLQQKSKQAKNYNKRHGVVTRDEFRAGDVVWVRDLSVWGKIQKLADTPRSYIITTSRGTFRRNSFHLVNAYHKEIPYVPEEVREISSQQSSQPLPDSGAAVNGPSPAEEQSEPPSPEGTTSQPVIRTRYGRIIKKPDRFTSTFK